MFIIISFENQKIFECDNKSLLSLYMGYYKNKKLNFNNYLTQTKKSLTVTIIAITHINR